MKNRVYEYVLIAGSAMSASHGFVLIATDFGAAPGPAFEIACFGLGLFGAAMLMGEVKRGARAEA